MTTVRSGLPTPAELRTLFQRYGFHPNKSRGQNFLVDNSAMESLLRALPSDPETPVLEIGPGFGAVTRYLLGRYQRVSLLEIDPLEVQYLRETFGENERLALQEGDATDSGDLARALDAAGATERRKAAVVANLPYSVGTAVLLRLFPEAQRLQCAVILLQEDVGARLGAEAPSKDRTFLTILRENCSNVEYLRRLGTRSFFPPPTIVSRLLRLNFHAPTVSGADLARFEAFVSRAFSQKRKKLRNTVPLPSEITLPEDIAAMLDRRAETLSFVEIITLWRHCDVPPPQSSTETAP